MPLLSSVQSWFRRLPAITRSWISAIRSGLRNWRTTFFYGIRAKLALFTGSLIFATILIFSFMTVSQQTQILQESYQKQVEIPRRFIASLVLELDNTAQSLIRIEEFRIRVARQTKELARYKTTTTEKQDKAVSLFGMKTSLFGALGTKSVQTVKASYYSSYLSKDDIGLLERRIRAELSQSAGREISESSFSLLKKHAAEYAQVAADIQENQENIIQIKTELESDEKIKTNPKAVSSRENRVRELEIQITKSSPRLKTIRAKLDTNIIRLLADAKKQKVRELGLDTSKFRVQTFTATSLALAGSPEPTLDTRVFAANDQLNTSDINPALSQSLTEVFTSWSSADVQSVANTDLELGDRELVAGYAPQYRNPGSTRRLYAIYPLVQRPGNAVKEALDIDREVAEAIAVLYPQIEARVTKLREMKPPVPPSRDKEFNRLYKEYGALLEKRRLALEKAVASEYAERFRIQDTESRENATSDITSAQMFAEDTDALLYLREAALEDQVLLRYRADGSEYDAYLVDETLRNTSHKRWAELRNWIMKAESETPPPRLKALFSEGIIGNSRTEAEAIMFRLDAAAIKDDPDKSLRSVLHSYNFAGIIRTLIDQTEGLREIRSNRDSIIGLAFLVALIAIVVAIFISGIVVQKIKRIIRSAEEVGAGSLNVVFEDGGSDEFGKLTNALNSMVTDLKDREQIKMILGSMVDPVVVGEAKKDLAALKRGTEKRITAFFSDIAGFSSISEKLTPPELADLLNEYLSAMTIILKEEDGVLDKYIGDAIVGIWNAPVDVQDHTLKAVRASLRMQSRLLELRAEWNEQKKYIPEAREMTFRIGLNTGPAKVGFMGTDALASYTMMGDTVNTAARLEAAGKDYGVAVLATDAVYEEVKESVFTRKLDRVRVKGKNEPVFLYEIIAMTGKETEAQKKVKVTYEKAFGHYLAREFSEAAGLLERIVKFTEGHDKPSQMLLDRCRSYEANPPAADWDGVFTRTTK